MQLVSRYDINLSKTIYFHNLISIIGHHVCNIELAKLLYKVLTCSRFIEENNEYKNQQKEIQRKRGSPPGMAPQELMMYWGV